MAKTPKKHEPILLPENFSTKPVKYPWVWFVLLVLGAILTFWRTYVHDKAVIRYQHELTQQQLQQQETERLQFEKELAENRAKLKKKN